MRLFASLYKQRHAAAAGIVKARAWCHVQNWTAVATCVIAIASVIVSWLQWTAIKGQLAEMQTERRPWVKVVPTIDGDVTINPPEGGTTGRDGRQYTLGQPDNTEFKIGFELSNKGHFVALSAAVFSEVRPYGFMKIAPTQENEFCTTAKLLPNLWPGHTIFGGDGYSMHNESYVVPNSLIETAVSSDKRFWVLIVGCVVYRSEGDRYTHQTPFFWQMYHWLPDHPNAMTSFHFVTGSVVGKPDLRLREIYVEGQEPN